MANQLLHDRSDFDNLIDNFKNNNSDFQVQYSSSKIVILKGKFKYVYYPNPVKSMKNMYFIKKVRDYIDKNNIEYPVREQISYNNYRLKMKKNCWYSKDIYEIDLKSAYWHFARQNNFINDEIYKEGLTVDKKIRLMSLGALAKNIHVFNYKDGILTNSVMIKSEKTENIFFKVAKDTDIVMKNIINLIPEQNFFFYWVDAVFFKGNEIKNQIETFLNDNSIMYKTVPIKKIILKDKCIIAHDYDFNVRPFNFRKSETIKAF
jgi:hypothetical protein